MLRTVAISTFFFVGVVSVAHADVFRWVDEHGGVHYSDQWVPGSEVIKSTTPRPTPSNSGADTSTRHSAPAEKPASTSGSSASSDSNAAKAVKQDMAKMRDQQCKDAKEKYEKAIEARRIYKSTDGDKAKNAAADGTEERQYLSEEEADAYRVRIRQEMQDVCGPSATK
jgi:hypothetical protein